MKIQSIVTGLLFFLLSNPSFSAISNPTTPTPTPKFTPQQVKMIEKIVHDYLVQHPETLVEASNALQAQEEQKQKQFAMKAIIENKSSLFDATNSPISGNPQGSVVVVEFFDYQCGHCKAMSSIVQQVLEQDPHVKMIFKELPIFGENSQFAAKAALASMQQGEKHYFAFHNALLSSENPLNKDKILKIAESVGLNTAKLQLDMNSPAVVQELKDNFALAQNLRLVGTPTFVIANRSLTRFDYIPGAASKAYLLKSLHKIQQGS